MSDLLLIYYGDDFTGSTDVMEALVLGGVPTVLFLEAPERAFVERQFPDARAIGVAGISRSMTPAQMDHELPSAFMALKALGAPLFHYKTCSTFDSSPTIGSIGHATEIGWQVFAPRVVPLLVGAPALKRYVVFGNLFATVQDQTYRLDRHPTMSKHPVTPMAESDLRLHLGKQTSRTVGLVDVRHLAQAAADIDAFFEALIEQGHDLILFDTLEDAHLSSAGRLIWGQRGASPGLVVGSSGVEAALTLYWQSVGIVQKSAPLQPPGAVDQLIVMCGSASPTTATQIGWALKNDFQGISLNSVRLIDPTTLDAERERLIAEALRLLASGTSLVLYSALGPDDPALAETRQAAEQIGIMPSEIGARLGKQQGIILRTLLAHTGLKRACVAGGDSSGHAALQLGIYALEILIPIAPGAPLCRARANDPQFDGLQIALKGGQNGPPDYFGLIRRGYA